LSTPAAAATALAAALVFGISSVADQRSTKRVQSRRALSPRILLDLVRQPLWLTAIGANLLAFALQVLALDFGSLALVQPILVCDLIFAVLIAWYLRQREDKGRPGARQGALVIFAGVAATTAGVAGFLAIGQPSGGQMRASFSTLPVLVAGLVVVVGGCLVVAARNPGLRPLGLALACGVCYGVSAFVIKIVTSEFGSGLPGVLRDWPIYVLAVVGPLGFLLNQDAFQQGTRLAPVQAIITTADPVISIALGVLWLHVRLRTSPAATFGEVASLLLMTAGIVVVAHRSPQVAGRAAAEQSGGQATPTDRPAP
jgi:hypothetical protein